MANKNNRPQCSHCFGTNWEKIAELKSECSLSTGITTTIYLWSCGHGAAHAEEMTNGCSRVIAATEEEMSHGGVI